MDKLSLSDVINFWKYALKKNQTIGMNVVFGWGEGGSEIKSTAPDPRGNGLELETSLWSHV